MVNIKIGPDLLKPICPLHQTNTPNLCWQIWIQSRGDWRNI